MLHQNLYSDFPHKTNNFIFNGELNWIYNSTHNMIEWTFKSLILIPWNEWKKLTDFWNWFSI